MWNDYKLTLITLGFLYTRIMFLVGPINTDIRNKIYLV